MSISFDDLAKLKVGDIIFECEMGLNLKAKVLSVPVEGKHEDDKTRRTLKWDAINTENNDPIVYFVTEGFMHYGPRLYTEPQYVYIKKGTHPPEFVFPLVGAKS